MLAALAGPLLLSSLASRASQPAPDCRPSPSAQCGGECPLLPPVGELPGHAPATRTLKILDLAEGRLLTHSTATR